MPLRKGTLLNAILLTALVIYAVLRSYVLLSTLGGHTNDFDTYYYAALVWASGGDPYSLEQIAQIADKPIRLGFVYPPLTLPVFRILTFFPEQTARYLFFSLKLACAVFLLLLWKRAVLRTSPGPIFVLFFLTAFGETVVLDLYYGNISLLEQAPLWLSFFLIANGKKWVPTGLITAVSLFKFTPIAFLLLLLRDFRRNLVPFLCGVAAFLFVGLAQYQIQPDMTSSFVSSMVSLEHKSGVHNPSSYAFIRGTLRFAANEFGLSIGPGHITIFYLCFALFVLLVSWRYAFRFLNSRFPYAAVFLMATIMALILPRFKDYSYILLIPSAYVAFALLRGWVSKAAYLTFVCFAFPLFSEFRNVFFSLSAQCVLTQAAAQSIADVMEYHALLSAFCIWIIFLLRGSKLNDVLCEVPRAMPA